MQAPSWISAAAVLLGASAVSPAASEHARMDVRTDEVAGRIHPHVYGQFLEHIYHSVEDGLFGELVRNRAFVPPQGFRWESGSLVQTAGGTDVKVFAGDPAWTDYEFSLKARKRGGAEGFLILVRAADEKNFYWWNLGGWGNAKHGLEAEVNDARRMAGPFVEGRIEPDRWYSIRVRVEGDHIEGWLDDAKLLDARDGTHKAGRVGVGTWATQAEFKDFRVADLKGQALPVDFSKAADASAVATDWIAWPPSADGAVPVVPVADLPNTGWAARIDLAGSQGPRGLAQKRFNAVAGHKYVGTAWMQVEGAVGRIRVSLLGGDGKPLASEAIEPRWTGWNECRFTLAPSASDVNATLAITAEGSGALVVDMVSLMRDDSIESGCRADLLEAVRAIRPSILRWPGGCFASIYRWKRAIGPQRERKPFFNVPWNEWDSAGFGTDEYMRLCRLIGAEPLIVMNLGSWDSPTRAEEYLAEALEWIEYCNGDASTPMGKLRAAHGHPEPYHVTHWELDNETWNMKVDGYAERLIPIAKAIRQRWPKVRLYACTFWEKEDGRLLELAGEYIDYISYHLYEDPNKFAEAPLNLEAIWTRYADMIARSRNPKARLAVTEWNAQSTDWRTGLFAGGLLNVMERSGSVEMATPALFLRRVDAPDWDNAFINHNHVTWFPAPNYVVMKLYRDHYQPNRLACRATGGLNAVATMSDDNRVLVIKAVNPTAADVPCSVAIRPAFSFGKATEWTVKAGLDDRNTLEAPGRVAPVQRPLTPGGALFEHVFPAYSVTVLELERGAAGS